MSTLATDNFQRANENPLSDGGNWLQPGIGSPCQLVSDAVQGTAAAAYNLAYWSAQGSTITAYLNGTQVLQATDTNITSGSAGIAFFPSSTLANSQLSSWSGGNFQDSSSWMTTSLTNKSLRLRE